MLLLLLLCRGVPDVCYLRWLQQWAAAAPPAFRPHLPASSWCGHKQGSRWQRRGCLAGSRLWLPREKKFFLNITYIRGLLNWAKAVVEVWELSHSTHRGASVMMMEPKSPGAELQPPETDPSLSLSLSHTHTHTHTPTWSPVCWLLLPRGSQHFFLTSHTLSAPH